MIFSELVMLTFRVCLAHGLPCAQTIIYNFLPAPKGATLQQLHDMARELLPKGTRLGIIDPFYKV